MATTTRPKERHRRSVSLEPQAKSQVDRIAEIKGVTINRAIEKAVEFYSQCLRIQERENGEIVAFIIQHLTGSEKTVHVMLEV